MNTQDPTIHLQTILASYLENEKASSTLETAVPSLLSIIQQHALLTRVPPTSTTTLHQWTTKLNTLLHSKQPGIRWAAILLIGITCEQNRSLFRENVQTWAGLLLGNLNKPQLVAYHTTTIEVLCDLLLEAKLYAELQRDVITANVPKFTTILLSPLFAENPDSLSTVFTTLMKLLTNFPSTLKPFTTQIEALCLNTIAASRQKFGKELVSKAADCLVTLSLVGLQKGSQATVLPDDLMRKMLGSVNIVLDEVFVVIDEERQVKIASAYELPKIVGSFATRLPKYLDQLKGLFFCLQTILNSSYTLPVNVPALLLLNVLCRILDVCEGSLRKKQVSNDDFHTLLTFLPSFYEEAILTLSALTKALGTLILPHARLLTDLLHKTHSYTQTQPFLRVSFYDFVDSFIQTVGPTYPYFASTIQTKIVQTILKDIRVETKQTTILLDKNVDAVMGKQSGKKKRGQQSHVDAEGIAPVMENSMKLDIRLAALHALGAILIEGKSIQPSLRTEIDRILIESILQSSQAQFSAQLRTQNYETRYTETMESEIRSELYTCFLNSVLTYRDGQVPNIGYATKIFQNGLNGDLKLRKLCRSALLMIEPILHARIPIFVPYQYEQHLVPASGHDGAANNGTTTDVTNADQLFGSRHVRQFEAMEPMLIANQVEETKPVTTAFQNGTKRKEMATEEENDEMEVDERIEPPSKKMNVGGSSPKKAAPVAPEPQRQPEIIQKKDQPLPKPVELPRQPVVEPKKVEEVRVAKEEVNTSATINYVMDEDDEDGDGEEIVIPEIQIGDESDDE